MTTTEEHPDSERIRVLNEHRVRADRAQADLTLISEALLHEAEERGWCSEYNEFVEEVNRRCSAPWLKPMGERIVVRLTVIARLPSGYDRDGMARELDQALVSILEDARASDIETSHD